MVLVHPALQEIDGHPAVNDLSAVAPPVDTVTLYVGPALSASMEESLTALRPRRVLFNPGAENPQLAAKLAAAGIHTEEACTLVLLSTGTF